MTEEGYAMTLPLDVIVVPENRTRELDEDKVTDYERTIADVGLIHALTVREPDEDGKYVLVSGNHRLAACRNLGLLGVRCFVRALSDDQAVIVENEENLFGASLSAAERIKASGLWSEKYEIEHPQLGHGGDRKSDAAKIKIQDCHFDKVDEVLSKMSGRSKRRIQDDLSVYKKIDPDVLDMLAKTPVGENFSQLKALSKQLPENQLPIADAIVRGDAETVKGAIDQRSNTRVAPMTEAQLWASKLRKIWVKGSKREQDKFLAEIGATRS